MMRRDLGRGMASAGTRRSPMLFAGVVVTHGMLVALLLQGGLTVPLIEAVDPASRVASGGRLQVLLMEPPLIVPRTAESAPSLTLAAELVDLPERPTIEWVSEEPNPDERLAGLYLGQLRARISRAWESLSVGHSPALPDCVVQLVQDDRGDVLEVAVRDCPVASPMRERLIQAVWAAAPLPAPPATLPGQARIELRLRR